jgi:hypothetical protein
MSALQENVAKQLVNVTKTILFSIFFHERFLLILTKFLNVNEEFATHLLRKFSTHQFTQ